MLTYNNQDIKVGQAFKLYDTYTLGHLEQDYDDISGSKRKLVARECKNVFEVIGAIFTIDIYYNNVLFKSGVHTFCDYYGFFESAKAINESIEDMSKVYDLDSDLKFDIRVSYQIERKMFYRVENQLREFDNSWFYSFKDAEQFFEMVELSDDDLSSEMYELRKNLDVSRPSHVSKPIEIYSSLKNGLSFTEEYYSEFKNQYLDNGYIIKEKSIEQ